MAFDWPDSMNCDPKCANIPTLAKFPYCHIDSKFPIRAALIGDLHANALYEFVARNSESRHKGLIMLGHAGCPPFLGVERDNNNCVEVMKQIVQYLNAHKEIKNVFIYGAICRRVKRNILWRPEARQL